MHSGWQPYFKAIVISLLSLGLPLFVRALSLFFSRNLEPSKPVQSNPEPSHFNSRFYLPALTLNFVILGLLILSVGISEISKGEHSERIRIYGSLFFGLLLFLALVFLFVLKKGNLNWNIGTQTGQKNE